METHELFCLRRAMFYSAKLKQMTLTGFFQQQKWIYLIYPEVLQGCCWVFLEIFNMCIAMQGNIIDYFIN